MILIQLLFIYLVAMFFFLLFNRVVRFGKAKTKYELRIMMVSAFIFEIPGIVFLFIISRLLF